jgi:hypothetical protein
VAQSREEVVTSHTGATLQTQVVKSR